MRYFQTMCEYKLKMVLKYSQPPVNTTRSVHLLPLCKVRDGEHVNSIIAYSTRCALIGQFHFNGRRRCCW